MGAPILVRTGCIDPLEIALEEFEKGVVPITVKRHYGEREVVVT